MNVESELKAALYGCALVGEIDLDSRAAIAAIDALRAAAPENRHRLDRLYPACLCVALVRHGATNYRRNGFWIGFDTWGLPQWQVGTQFLEALSRLGLERFDRFLYEDNARRYVAHALLHAGFARPAAVQVFRLLAESLRLGAGDGPSIVTAWRRDPVLMESLRSPARRFVQQGGDLAVDLVDRMVDVLVAAADGEVDATSFGLPSHIASAFAELGASERRVGQRRRLPAPVIVIEPGTGMGPTVLLPAVPQRAAHEWLVSTGQQKARRSVSSGSEQAVEIHPAAGWSVVAQAGGHAVRSFEFRGFGRSVYLFSPDGILLDPQKPVRHDRVLVLAPTTFESRVDSADGESAAIVEEFPPLAGTWHRYCLQDVFVGDTARLWLGPSPHAAVAASALLVVHPPDAWDDTGREEAGGVVIPIGATTDRPVLVGEQVQGATWSGCPVLAVAPRIRLPLNHAGLHRWAIRTESHSGESRQVLASDLELAEGLVSIGSLVGAGAWAGSVTAQGPLGRDLRERFAVVPALMIDAADDVVAPDADLTVTISASISSSGGPGPWVHNIPAPADSTIVLFGDIEVEVSVLRLLWCIRSAKTVRTVFSSEKATIAADDITSGQDDLLFVRAKPSSEVYVELARGEAVLQAAKSVRCGSHGIAAVSLKQFGDTVRSDKFSALDLVVRVDAVQATVARVLARYESRVTTVESVIDGPAALIDLRFDENRPFRGRVVRFWSVTRPWEKPSDIPIDDRDEGRVLLLIHSVVPPGRYRVEVLVPYAWAMPQRPADLSRYGEVRIGTIADERRRLASLDRADPVTTLELLLDDPPLVVSIQDEDAEKVAWHCLLALVSEFAAGDPKVLATPAVRVARQVLFAVPEAAARAFARAAETGELQPDLLRRTAIALVPDFLDCPSGNRDGETLASLWEFSPMLGGAADSWGCGDSKEPSSALWRRYGGWDPHEFVRSDLNTWPGHIQGLDAPILNRSRQQIREIADALGDAVPMLAPGGAAAALLDWLGARLDVGDGPFNDWRSKFRPLNDRRIRHGIGQVLLDDAKEHATAIVWARFAQDLLAAALAFVQAPDDSREAPLALGALWNAHSLVRPLTEQVVLNAVVARRME